MSLLLSSAFFGSIDDTIEIRKLICVDALLRNSLPVETNKKAHLEDIEISHCH